MTTTTEALEPRLNPCRCGRKALVERFYDGDDPQPLFIATCEVCPVKTYDQLSAEEAARIWNEFVSAPIAPVVDEKVSGACRPLGYIYERPPEQQWCVTHNQPMNRCPLPATAPVLASPEVGNNLLKACREVLHNNGGVIDSLGGPDTYVMVRRADFELLDRADKAIRECAPASTVAPQQSEETITDAAWEITLGWFSANMPIDILETEPHETRMRVWIETVLTKRFGPASPAAIRDEALTLTDLQEAYNQGIEDAKCAIRAESQGGGYWAATYINAIARRCSPFRYTGLPADANDDDRERMINEAGLVDEVQHRMDQVVEAAVEWHQAGQEGGEWIEYADKLGAAINSLLELRDAPSKAATEYGAGAIVDRLVRISVEENADPSIRAKEAAEEILKRINAALTTTVPSEFIEAFGEGASVTIGQGAIPKIAAIIERVCFSTGNSEDQAMT